MRGDRGALSNFLRGLEENPDPELSAQLGLDASDDGEKSPRPSTGASPEGQAPEPLSQAPAPMEPPAPMERDGLVEAYGEFVVKAAEEEGIDLNAWSAAWAAGQDTAELRAKLAARIGVPEAVVRQFEDGARQQGHAAAPASAKVPEPGAAGLSEQAVALIYQQVGGEAEFGVLSAWAESHLGQANPLVAGFNRAAKQGNQEAASIALAAIQQLRQADADAEPALVRGDAAPGGDQYESMEELQNDLAKVDQAGRNLYRTSAKFRKQVQARVARSPGLDT